MYIRRATFWVHSNVCRHVYVSGGFCVAIARIYEMHLSASISFVLGAGSGGNSGSRRSRSRGGGSCEGNSSL